MGVQLYSALCGGLAILILVSFKRNYKKMRLEHWILTFFSGSLAFSGVYGIIVAFLLLKNPLPILQGAEYSIIVGGIALIYFEMENMIKIMRT